MIAGLDSSFSRPTPDIIAQAWAAGVRVWGGYIATRANVGLASPWDRASFDVARTLGSKPIAFCSGFDDPVACRDLAAQWDVRLCLDVEGGIRPDGTWVQGWLDASGAGLYGQHYLDTNGVWHSIHVDRRAAFHVMSWYIGRDPGFSWTGPQSADGTPLAWQWEGSHQEFGLDVDRGWYDDWFGGNDMTPDEHQTLSDINVRTALLYNALFYGNEGPPGNHSLVQAQATADGFAQVLAAIKQPPPVDVNALATSLAVALATHPLSATLSDAERQSMATALAQHLSKDLAAG